MNDTITYRFVGASHMAADTLIFEDRDYPSDAPGGRVSDEDLVWMAPSHPTLAARGRYFAVTLKHAQVHGLIPSKR
jgi:hypothetical protein